MKKKTLFWIVGVIIVLAVIGNIADREDSANATDAQISNSQGTNAGSSQEVSESDILAILLHQPYLNATGIKVHCQSERKNMPQKIAAALQEVPYWAYTNDGGLFGTDYIAITNKPAYYYYGDVKNNRPDGFGVFAKQAVNLEDLDSISNLVYAGNFKEGLYDGYGVRFSSPSVSRDYVYESIRTGLLDGKYIDIAYIYQEFYVQYDGEWKEGVENGKGNFFDIDSVLLPYQAVQENYWGGPFYPTVTVSEINKGNIDGKTKQYANGVLIFDGRTKNGLRDGKGISYFVNGQKQYDGQWKNGKYNGQGKLYDTEGNLIYSGKWENGDYAS